MFPGKGLLLPLVVCGALSSLAGEVAPSAAPFPEFPDMESSTNAAFATALAAPGRPENPFDVPSPVVRAADLPPSGRATLEEILGDWEGRYFEIEFSGLVTYRIDTDYDNPDPDTGVPKMRFDRTLGYETSESTTTVLVDIFDENFETNVVRQTIPITVDNATGAIVPCTNLVFRSDADWGALGIKAETECALQYFLAPPEDPRIHDGWLTVDSVSRLGPLVRVVTLETEEADPTEHTCWFDARTGTLIEAGIISLTCESGIPVEDPLSPAENNPPSGENGKSESSDE